jgi:hypothetical protein
MENKKVEGQTPAPSEDDKKKKKKKKKKIDS